jgi:hypothetical protein
VASKLVTTAAVALAVGIGFSGTPAQATPSICPSIGSSTDGACNEVITFNADGSITTVVTNPNPYGGSDNNLVGIVNNTGSPIYSIVLSGGNLFGFDGDGLQAYNNTANPVGGTPDATGYGGKVNGTGENTSFSVADSDNGSVIFGTLGIPGEGGTAYFSLEEAPTLDLSVNGTPQVPEPGPLALLGTGLLGLSCVIRCRTR